MPRVSWLAELAQPDQLPDRRPDSCRVCLRFAASVGRGFASRLEPHRIVERDHPARSVDPRAEILSSARDQLSDHLGIGQAHRHGGVRAVAERSAALFRVVELLAHRDPGRRAVGFRDSHLVQQRNQRRRTSRDICECRSRPLIERAQDDQKHRLVRLGSNQADPPDGDGGRGNARIRIRHVVHPDRRPVRAMAGDTLS